MTQFRKPLLAGVCAALVAGSMSASTASAEELPVGKVAKRFNNFSKDALTVFKNGILTGRKAAEKVGDGLRGFSPATRAFLDKFIRDPISKDATRDIPANQFPFGLKWPERRQQNGPQFAPAPIFGRPLRLDPKYINPDGSRMTQQQRLRVKTVPPLFIRDLEKSRRANVYRPQRIVPISMPKGVLMRLGIDPKTYRRGSTSKSLLDRIRSRSS